MLSKDEIKRRQRIGIEKAKQNGKYHGRQRKEIDKNKLHRAFIRYCWLKYEKLKFDIHDDTDDVTSIASYLGISRRTFYRELHRYHPDVTQYAKAYEHQVQLENLKYFKNRP